ncbi:GNAT family N-acetyltransferase [Streptomyces sp. NPDC007189]|uniref:GNAT family N-acetyltransferase n=1 Tax=unclassified Streptomyces TaxID=2593676 RepID=UPI0033DAAF94
MLAWARQLPGYCEPLVLAVVDDDRPVAALALVRELARDGRARISPLSCPASEQIRPVGESVEAVSVLLDHLSGLGDEVLLADLPDSSLLARQAHSRWGEADAQTLYATVGLPADLAALSRSTRREHTRRRRTVQALGERVGCHRTRTGTELLAAFDALEDLHHRRNAPRPATAEAPDLDLPWRQVLKECAGVAFIATLTLDGHPVAAQLCLRRRDRVYSLIPAMDPAHRDLSAGHALRHFLCEDLTREGYTALDLGRTTAQDGQRSYKAAYGALWTATRTHAVHASGRPHAMQSAADLADAGSRWCPPEPSQRHRETVPRRRRTVRAPGARTPATPMTAVDAADDVAAADIAATRRAGVLPALLRSRIARPRPRPAARPWENRRARGHRPGAWPAPATARHAPPVVCACRLCRALAEHTETGRCRCALCRPDDTVVALPAEREHCRRQGCAPLTMRCDKPRSRTEARANNDPVSYGFSSRL